MNFLKKKLKPLTSGLSNNNSSSSGSHANKNKANNKDLEDDLYDEYVVEAPPHPSELLALGVDPTDIDVNDPEKLRELYRKAKEEGKDKQTNSILLARQRQKEEIEEKKKTREEWKFFDSITARVEQAVKESQKSLEHLKESSAVDKLTQPDYELRLTADEVFKSSATVKLENSANNWIDFSEGSEASKKKKKDEEEAAAAAAGKLDKTKEADELDEFGCPKRKTSLGEFTEGQKYIAEEILEDFGIDLRPASLRQQQQKQSPQAGTTKSFVPEVKQEGEQLLPNRDLKAVARPRPRPNATENLNKSTAVKELEESEKEIDPFDTSYAKSVEQALLDTTLDDKEDAPKGQLEVKTPAKALDPFDTSFVNL